jgi:two-component system sensor histidine kinase/response regulator
LFITLVRVGGPKRVNIDAVIDVLTVVAVSVLVFWNLSIEVIVTDATVSPVVRVVWAAYPVADAVLLALVLRALAGRRSRAAVGFTFGFGVLFWLAADLGYLIFPTSVAIGTWLDVGWLLGALLLAGSAWRRPTVAGADMEADDVETASSLAKLGIAIVPLMAPPVLVLLDQIRGRHSDPLDAVIGMAVLLTLAFARTARLLRSERRAKAAARKSHRHYACLAANSSDAVVVVDANWRLMNESPQLAALVGYEGPTRGVDSVWLLAPDDCDELRALFARVSATPSEVLDTEMQIQQRGGGRRWLDARMVNMLSASIGIAASDGDSGADALVRNADVAMYRAKISGKAQWVTYDPLMRVAAMERLRLETELEDALAGDQFRLLYQPLVRLETQQIVGFEALLRWHHPTLGLIMPDRFIPIAEESG